MAVGFLPSHAREELRRAARTPVKDERDRSRLEAIERCIARLRWQYPEHFKEDKDADRNQ
jgi:hypothetical protein